MKVSKTVLRIKDRDIIKVTVRNDYIQPFYRSTGRNSGMKNRWLPFKGILCYYETPVWFDKNTYHNTDVSELDRFGTEELKEVSEALSKISIPKGEEAKCSEINFWLGYKNSGQGY